MFRVLAILPLLITALPAAAQETQASASAKLSREFAASDRDGDGFLSRTEVDARIERMTSTQAKLTPDQKKKLSALWFSRADADGDSKVSQAEAQALMATIFQRYDANKDGKVGGNERAAARENVTGR